MKLKDLKKTYFQKENKYNFIIPIGATEQHGPFLPFGTDTYITDYLVNQVEKQFPEIIVLPTLEYSRSREHSGFYGTVWLSEETLEKVLFDICSSLKDKASNIFITSFHANDQVIKNFIVKYKNDFTKVNIVLLEMCDDEDFKEIEALLNGPLDEHAGNTEISNMLVIDEKLVDIPSPDYSKNEIIDPWSTGKLADKSADGIADNHPKWIVDRRIGEKILDIYTRRAIFNLEKYLNL